jgi:crotonobetainyl-CoA:carnitine CoA-transferase CaiB-like acyl-CoA transferase
MQVFYRTPWQWENDKVLVLRGDSFRDVDGNIKQEGTFPRFWQCKDGRVFFALTFSGARTLMVPKDLVQWMIDDGVDVGELAEIDWDAFDPSILTPERIESWTSIIGGFLTKHTRQELFEQGMARKVGIGPVLDIPEVLKNEQLEARNYWQEAEHPEPGQKVLYPGHLFLASETENQKPERAPHVGEHNEGVYGQEMGLSAQEIASLKEAGII